MKKNLISFAALVVCAVTLSGCCSLPCLHGSSGGSGTISMVAPAPAHAVSAVQPA